MADTTSGRAAQAHVGFDIIEQMTGGRFGIFDVPCPICGPSKRKLASQCKHTLRIWRLDPAFATYHCARCGESGYTRDNNVASIDPVKLARVRAEADAREREISTERLKLARWLWRRRQPLYGSVAERYLREARGYMGPLLSTLGYLPPQRNHPPALICVFGLATEISLHNHHLEWDAERFEPLPIPGAHDPRATTRALTHPTCSTLHIADTDVRGVHLVKLQSDGRDRLREQDAKITIGRGFVAPIVLAPPNDNLALTIAEGPEDALTAADLTNTGAWAAGSAVRLPGLAALVPEWIDCVTVLVDANTNGQENSCALGAALRWRGFEVRLTPTPTREAPR